MHFPWKGPFWNIFQKNETVFLPPEAKFRPFFSTRGRILLIFKLPEAKFGLFLTAGGKILAIFTAEGIILSGRLVGGPPSDPVWRGSLMEMHHCHHLKAATNC